MAEYVEKLRKDLVDQFRDKPNIEALADVIAHQLQDVFEFYEQLRMERDVKNAVGKQLDGIGDIVDLTRSGAGLLAGNPIPFDILDDETYRKYIIFKILKNTSHTTYPDIIKAFKMFWDRPLYYKEDPSEPATMIFDTGEMEGCVDTRPLFDVPLIRAAGVTLKLYARTKTELERAKVYMGGILGFAVTETELPILEREYDFLSKVYVGATFNRVTEDKLPGVERKYEFDGKLFVGSAMNRLSIDSIPESDGNRSFGSAVNGGGTMQSVMLTPINGIETQ